MTLGDRPGSIEDSRQVRRGRKRRDLIAACPDDLIGFGADAPLPGDPKPDEGCYDKVSTHRTGDIAFDKFDVSIKSQNTRFNRDLLAQFANGRFGQRLAKLDKTAWKGETTSQRRRGPLGEQHAITPEDGEARRENRARRIEAAILRRQRRGISHG